MQNYVIYKFLFLLILFILFLSIIIFYSNLFFPIILGWIFAYIFSPIINYFEKLKIKRTIIIFAFCFILIIIIILIMLFIIPTIIEQLKEMINFFGRNIKKLNIERYINLPEFKKNIDFYIKLIRINQSYITNILQLTSDFVQLFYKGLLNIFMIISQIFIFIISFIYFIYHFEIINFLIKKYLPVELREKILTYLSEIDILLRRYLRGQLLDCFIIGTLTTILLSILKIKFALLLGIITGLLTFIPYAGVGTGLIISIIICFFQYQSFQKIILLILFFGLIQFLDAVFIAPRIMGRQVGLSPLLIILSIIILSNIIGFVGVLLAIPIICVLKVTIKYLLNFYIKSNLYIKKQN